MSSSFPTTTPKKKIIGMTRCLPLSPENHYCTCEGMFWCQLGLLGFNSVNMVIMAPSILKHMCSIDSYGMSNQSHIFQLEFVVCKEKNLWNFAVFLMVVQNIKNFLIECVVNRIIRRAFIIWVELAWVVFVQLHLMFAFMLRSSRTRNLIMW